LPSPKRLLTVIPALHSAKLLTLMLTGKVTVAAIEDV
jgi:hypothetical protein